VHGIIISEDEYKYHLATNTSQFYVSNELHPIDFDNQVKQNFFYVYMYLQHYNSVYIYVYFPKVISISTLLTNDQQKVKKHMHPLRINHQI